MKRVVFWLTKYPERKLEYSIAFYTIIMGAWLMMPFKSMSSPSFYDTVRIMSEGTWGACYFTVGLCHLIALKINGRAAWTPFARTAALFLNSQVFVALALSFLRTAPQGTGIANYFLFAAVFCGPALVSAAHDCGAEIKILREARRGRL